MPKRSRMPDDPNLAAAAIVARVTGAKPAKHEETATPAAAPRRKNPAAVALGRRGGKKGGRARAAKLSPEQRREIAARAARARWAKDRA